MSMTTIERLGYLLRRYSAGQITYSEIEELSDFLVEGQFDGDIKEILERMLYEASPMEGYDFVKLNESVYKKIRNNSGRTKVLWIGRRRLLSKVSIAAALLISIFAGGYYVVQSVIIEPTFIRSSPGKLIERDVAPGRDKAILTLSDGTEIVLDTAAQGRFTEYESLKVLKIDAGRISYKQDKESGEKVIEYNTVSTPRGGQYLVELSDGTKVWLNSASSLRFPTVFVEGGRNVELSGEAYFEVTKNEKYPFSVRAKEIEILVLGTHFNVNSYDDEGTIKTTLLQGSIREKIIGGDHSVTIVPGQQVEVGLDKVMRVVDGVDLIQVVAWQSGLFEFNNCDLFTIMRQISRWYDVDVVYEGKPGDTKFGGGISKNLPLSNVLQLLQENGVKFQLEGKILTVIP